ncbi:MAG: hypothetical protein H0V19_02605 [Euzebyales bacterium]|nr:hypothetical protein [Euzebyales bacterium]
MTRKTLTWLFGYGLVLALLAWYWSSNPASSEGLPADPRGRVGILSVVVLPASVLLGLMLSRLDDDQYGMRYIVVTLLAAAVTFVALMVGFLPDDLRSCLALRRLPVLPPRCSTTPDLRYTVIAESTVDWLLFGAAWAGATRWRRSRSTQRERAGDALV